MQIVIMTWNIHRGRGRSGKHCVELDRTLRIIRRSNPSVLAIQEMDDRNLVQKCLRSRWPGSWAITRGVTADRVGGSLQMARWQVSGNVLLTNLQYTSSTRETIGGFAIAKRIQLPDNRIVNFVCCHFKAGRENTATRLRQSTMVAEFSDNSSHPVIIAGDLNCTPDSPEFSPLSDRFSKPEGATILNTQPHHQPARQIDYILTDKRHQWNVHSIEALDDGGASDHFPIVLKLDLN